MTQGQIIALAGLLILLALAGITAMMLRRLHYRSRAKAQLEKYAQAEVEELPEEYAEEESRDFFRQWLYTSGYRSASAPSQFLLSTLLCGGVGTVMMIALVVSGMLELTADLLDAIPANLGTLVMPLVILSPLIVIGFPAMIPMLLVRARRRRIVREIGEDFPIFLDLLATLTEGGLGFDQALDRISDLQPGDRMLPQELVLFRADLLGGQRRVDALRRMSDRLDIPVISNFTSAVAQAEQAGSGLARTIRLQAEDFRQYRREAALNLAQALSIKLIVPLVLFFAPGLFIATLGPTVYRIFVRLGAFVDEVAPPTNFEKVEQERIERERQAEERRLDRQRRGRPTLP
ncbi:MAG: type II secretion system F family protein [Pirellulales bacterium]|nr:type II secretion system F family protein [Pirellulales bacterium]